MFTQQTIDLLKLRAFLLKKARGWLDDNGYVEAQGPVLVPALDESPSSLEVKYFDKRAYLTKGFLPYGVFFANGLGKVYTVMPAFRKELPSRRHLVEYWRLEVVEHCDLEKLMKTQEQVVAYLCLSLLDIKETLKCFNRSALDLAKMQVPFNRMTYDEAIETLQADSCKISWGQEISWELEQHLSRKFDKPFFIWKYPSGPETFFAKADPEKPELSLYADLIAPEGYGELASSLQMVTEKQTLTKLLKEVGISKKGQLWFSSFMLSHCEQPCSGFAIGIERLVRWVCKLSQIKEATAFPRTPDNIYP